VMCHAGLRPLHVRVFDQVGTEQAVIAGHGRERTRPMNAARWAGSMVLGNRCHAASPGPPSVAPEVAISPCRDAVVWHSALSFEQVYRVLLARCDRSSADAHGTRPTPGSRRVGSAAGPGYPLKRWQNDCR
jgi:hypothetical protein